MVNHCRWNDFYVKNEVGREKLHSQKKKKKIAVEVSLHRVVH